MKYRCLVYRNQARLAGLSDADCIADDRMRCKSGRHLASEALQTLSSATTVRIGNGESSVADRPFAEITERLAVFHQIEARDLNEAIQVKAKIPAARMGTATAGVGRER